MKRFENIDFKWRLANLFSTTFDSNGNIFKVYLIGYYCFFTALKCWRWCFSINYWNSSQKRSNFSIVLSEHAKLAHPLFVGLPPLGTWLTLKLLYLLLLLLLLVLQLVQLLALVLITITAATLTILSHVLTGHFLNII